MRVNCVRPDKAIELFSKVFSLDGNCKTCVLFGHCIYGHLAKYKVVSHMCLIRPENISFMLLLSKYDTKSGKISNVYKIVVGSCMCVFIIRDYSIRIKLI